MSGKFIDSSFNAELDAALTSNLGYPTILLSELFETKRPC